MCFFGWLLKTETFPFSVSFLFSFASTDIQNGTHHLISMEPTIDLLLSIHLVSHVSLKTVRHKAYYHTNYNPRIYVNCQRVKKN